MAQRICIGRHPFGANGIFASPPGIDVLNTDPASYLLALSTSWGQTANVLQSGLCALNQTVPIGGSPTFYPMVLFQELIGSGYWPHKITRNSINNPTNQLTMDYVEQLSQWKIVHNQTSFYITAAAVNIGEAQTSATFRYVVFNLPAYP
jgi:hypothetical protein